MKKILNSITGRLSANRPQAHFAAGLILTLYISLLGFAPAVFIPIFLVFIKELAAAGVRSSRDASAGLSPRWGLVIAAAAGSAVAAVPVYLLING